MPLFFMKRKSLLHSRGRYDGIYEIIRVYGFWNSGVTPATIAISPDDIPEMRNTLRQKYTKRNILNNFIFYFILPIPHEELSRRGVILKYLSDFCDSFVIHPEK